MGKGIRRTVGNLTSKKSKGENFKMRRKNQLFILSITCLLLLHISVLNSSLSEWKLKVSTEKANIRLKPDIDSPVESTVVKGTALKSHEKIGEWFRVIIGPDEKGFVVIGFVHSSDVEIISEKTTKEPDFWEEEPEFFKGIGLSVKLSGGLGYFVTGDIEKGTRGLFDSTADFLSSAGYTLESRTATFHKAKEFAGDIIFNITPRVGIGIGVGSIYASVTNILTASGGDLWMQQYASSPTITAVPIRLGLFFTLPIHRLFSVTFNGGAAHYWTKYSYALATDWLDWESIFHSAKAKSFGFHGGIGLEINLNKRATFFIEGQGRYAKISNFKGTTQLRKWEIYDYSFSIEEGTLYYLEDENHPYLAIFKEEPSGYKTVRKATFDFSGFSLRVGLRAKF